MGEILVDVVHVGILLFGLVDDALQGGVLIEIEELGVYLGVVDIAYLQHVLNQGAGLIGIVGAHLLKGREVASGEIETLNTVIAFNGECVVGIPVVGFQTPFATDAHHQYQCHYEIKLVQCVPFFIVEC